MGEVMGPEGGGGGGGCRNPGKRRGEELVDHKRVLVGFGVDSDLKMMSKMKKRMDAGRESTRSKFSLTKNSMSLVDLQIAFRIGRKKGSLAELVLDHFPGKYLDKTCTLTDWLRRPLVRNFSLFCPILLSF
jgi:hypothetical protein